MLRTAAYGGRRLTPRPFWSQAAEDLLTAIESGREALPGKRRWLATAALEAGLVVPRAE